MRDMFVRTRFGIPAFWQIAAGVVVLLGAIALVVVASISNITWLLAAGMVLIVVAGAGIAFGVTAINQAEDTARQQRQADLTGEAVARSLRQGTQDR